jgi:outer membrane protein
MRFAALAIVVVFAGPASLAAAAEAPEPSPSAAVPSRVPAPLPLASPAPIPIPSPVASAAELPSLSLDDRNGGVTLTLDDSVRLAVASATAVLKADNATRQSGADVLRSYGQFLPNLVAQGNYAYQSGTQYYAQSLPTLVNGSSAGAGYTLSTDLNLFNGLADYSGLRATTLRKDVAELSLARAKQAVALDTTQSFLQVVLDNQLVGIARKNLQESQAREKLLEEQTVLGVRNLSDLFRQQAQTSLDESALLTAQNRTRTDQITFLRKLRADVAKSYRFVEPTIPDDEPPGSVGDEGSLLKKALTERVDLKASDESAEASGWDLKGSWGGYLPKLDLQGSMVSGAHYLYSQAVNGQSVVPPTQSSMGYQLGSQIDYTVGLYLTWSIFDQFGTHDAVTKARVASDNAQIDAQDFRNQVEGEVRTAFGSYETSVAQLRSSKKGLVAARKAYEVIEGRYEVGSASFIDLITAQATLVQAESARAEALIDFVLQSKGLEFAIGELKAY